MKNLCWLAQIGDLENEWVGDKAFLLSQALRCGLPVMPGFVLSAQVSQKFFANLEKSSSLFSNLDQFPDYLNSNNYQALQALSLNSRSLVLDSNFPLDVQKNIFTLAQQLNSAQLIIRPSLTANRLFSQGTYGLIKSQICCCEAKEITQAIKLVWADIFAVKNLFYRHQLGLNFTRLKLAILIQPINNVIASGTVTINSQTANVQAIWGLGHGLNNGEVDPDRYRISLDLEDSLSLGQSKVDRIGSKRRAYHLVTKTISTTKSIFLEPNTPSEEQQQRVLLLPPQIKAISTISNQLNHLPTPCAYWEWALLPKINSDSHELIITQINFKASNLQDIWFSVEERQDIVLRGIPAAPGRVSGEIFVAQSLDNQLDCLKTNSILVTKSIEPQNLNLIHNLAGIITEQGGRTSHCAIIARELGIPTVVAAKEATAILQTGNLITLDGTQGLIISTTTTHSKFTKNNNEHRVVSTSAQLSQPSQIPLATKLLVTLSQVSSIDQAKNLPVEGVGLLRSEFMIMKILSQRPLHEWLKSEHQPILLEYLVESLSKFVQEFSPRPIYYRSLDFPLVDSNHHDSQQRNRGTYAYLQNSSFFELELAALARTMERRQSNLKLILPFVRSLREWQFCYNLVQKAGLPNYPNFQLWIMLEVPSLIFMLPEYIEAGVQGVAIGMNDLTQLLLGVKRKYNELSQQNLTGNFLAIEKAIVQIIQTTKENRIPCSICLSDQSGNLDLLDKLVNWGVNMISVEPQSVLTIHQGIIQAERRLIEDI